ncbi:biotin--[acetyl-CoA-carboxylase] ligase [Microbacterium sp. 179-I 3D4 NHS]|uniref:biotin--[acetyl-CoA-carboxylase] ligase n=1 Tax=Microbacterium sp. 179-I 3D4 NHS TaxID=3142381 RepID=UPI0039A06D9F
MSGDFPRARAAATRLESVPQSGSTNADLRALVAEEAAWPHLSVLLTRNQTAGRGRLDRSWVAPAGTALAVSVILRRPADPSSRAWIPLLAGAAMADAIAAQLPDAAVSVKWPNDVLVADRKISGILAEVAGDAVVVGAGVNTAMDEAQLPVPTATSFAVRGVAVDEDLLVADYLGALARRLDDLIAAGDPVASGAWEAVSERCSTIGRAVRVMLPGDETLDGTAVGLDAEGRLRVVAQGRERAVPAGDVVHVRPRRD